MCLQTPGRMVYLQINNLLFMNVDARTADIMFLNSQ